MLAATDPANPYGAALPWPERPATGTPPPGTASGHRPGRKAGALVVLVDGELVVYVERGGRTLLSFADDPAVLQPAADALALAVHAGQLGRLQVERADGGSGRRLARWRRARRGRVPPDAARAAAARLTGGGRCPRATSSGARRAACTTRSPAALTVADLRVPALATVDLVGHATSRRSSPAASTC